MRAARLRRDARPDAAGVARSADGAPGTDGTGGGAALRAASVESGGGRVGQRVPVRAGAGAVIARAAGMVAHDRRRAGARGGLRHFSFTLPRSRRGRWRSACRSCSSSSTAPCWGGGRARAWRASGRSRSSPRSPRWSRGLHERLARTTCRGSTGCSPRRSRPSRTSGTRLRRSRLTPLDLLPGDPSADPLRYRRGAPRARCCHRCRLVVASSLAVAGSDPGGLSRAPGAGGRTDPERSAGDGGSLHVSARSRAGDRRRHGRSALGAAERAPRVDGWHRRQVC